MGGDLSAAESLERVTPHPVCMSPWLPCSGSISGAILSEIHGGATGPGVPL